MDGSLRFARVNFGKKIPIIGDLENRFQRLLLSKFTSIIEFEKL